MLIRSFLLLACVAAFFTADLFAADRIQDSGFDLSLGYRVDQLDWSISGDKDGTNPNVLSELIWTDLEILQTQLDAWVETRDLLWLNTNTLFLAKAAYGKIFVGYNRDSDYAGDNRTLEWSRSENQSDDGYTLDLSGAFGPKYELLQGKLYVAPLIGYSFHIQNLELTEGVQTVSENGIYTTYFGGTDNPAPLGPITNLNSSYTAYWFGPWLGANVQLLPFEKWSFDLSAEYHIVEYFAEADWNLRANLAHPVSFEHEAHGNGIILSAKSVYELNQRWSAFFSGNVQFWETGDGVDTTFFANGTRGGTQLNEVNWESYAVMFGVSCHF